MSRIFLSLHPYYEGGPIVGRKQANLGFINALFRRDPFDIYHFFVDNPAALMKLWENVPEAAPILDRGGLQAFARTTLPRRLKTVPYSVCHFSDPMTEFIPMCRARNLLAPHLFPVTAVNHTISYTEHAEKTLAHVWEGCSPRDGVGVTSVASQKIMEGWYAHARSVYNLPEAWPQPQLKVIPLGVPDPELGVNEDLRTELRNRLKVDADTVMILLYGRISQADKMDMRPLFSALRRVRLHHPQAKFFLFLAGAMKQDDPIKESLLELSKAWGIPFGVAPNPSRNLKKQLFAAADVFVSPTDNIQETFGLTLVEAAQSGLPVIASDWDGYRDIVVHDETGFLIPTVAPTDTPYLDSVSRILFNQLHQLLRSQQTVMHVPALEEALVRLISDTPLRKRMGSAARERAEKLYSFDKVVDRWVEFWEELNTTPISAEQEAIMRTAKHPHTLDYGKVFACYATGHLNDDTVLKVTDLGAAFIARKAPWNNFALASVNLKENLLHSLMAVAREDCTFGHLMKTAQESPWGARKTDENLRRHILWLLKQDLLQCAL